MDTNKDWTNRYFPERFRRRHKSAYRLATQMLTGQKVLMPTQDMVERLQRLLMEDYNKLLSKIPLESRPTRVSPIISRVMSSALHLARFHVSGRQIYDISPRMLKVLSSADYRDVLSSMLVLPFPSVYLHFGSQPFTIKGAPFEGALVSMEKGIVEFTFVTTPSANWHDGNMISHPHHYLYLSLNLNDQDVDSKLGTIVDYTIATERSKLEEDARIPESSESHDGITLIDRRGAGFQEDLENFEIGVTSIDDAMNLVINTLIYITSYREHVNTRWTENTPIEISNPAEGKGRPKQVVQARVTVIENGYYKAHFVGERSEHGEDDGISTHSGNAIMPHWRRAHWRLQVCGAGRQERKMLLVPRVLVNADQIAKDTEVSGRVSRI